MDYRELLNYKQNASAWAQGVFLDPQAIVLDTETTGFGATAQIIELGIVNARGEVLMDQRLMPSVGIDAGAEAVHGISMAMLVDSPTMADVYDELMRIFADASRVIIYNASYDRRLLRQTLQSFSLWEKATPLLNDTIFECAMLRYAEWVGEWNEGKGSFKWQKLVGGDHSAVGDCMATLAYLQMMADGADLLGQPMSGLAQGQQKVLSFEIRDGA